MNNGAGIQSMLLVLSLTLSILCTGCKPEIEKEKGVSLSPKPTPAISDHFQEEGIIPHKAKFSRKWED